MALPKYSYGYEWKNSRGQVFVYLPDHPMCRGDGFYARAKFIMEEQIAAERLIVYRMGNPSPEQCCGPYFVVAADDCTLHDINKPRFLRAEERVYHMDGDPGNDDPSNFMLFPSQKMLMEFRSQEYHATKDLNYKDRLRGLTQEQQDLRDEVGVERAHQQESRRRSAIKAHKVRKQRLAKEAREKAKAEKDASKS